MDPQFWSWISSVTGAIPDDDALRAIENGEADVSVDAERLTQTILKMDRELLGLEGEVNAAALRVALDEALETISYEGLLLGLCHDRDIDEIVDAVEVMPNQTIEADEEGFAEIAAAVAALCANVARSRRAIGDTDKIDHSKIAGIVRSYWKKRPHAASSQVIPELIERFSQVFKTASTETLRAFLNLPAKAAEPPVKTGKETPILAEHAGDVSGEAMDAAAKRWRSACTEALRRLDTLRQAVDASTKHFSLAGFEFVGGSWKDVTAILDAVMDLPLDAAIVAIAAKAGGEKNRAIAEIRANIVNKLAQLQSNQKLSLLDGTTLLNGERPFRTVFEDALLMMRDLMAPRTDV
jgi:hypothetical protein